MTTASTPIITAVVCTRNRAESAHRCLRSLLAAREPDVEIIVVDQSDDGALESAVTKENEYPDVTYIRSQTCGIATARNIALAAARTEFVALTDDDCEVNPDWLQQAVVALNRDERIGLVFGNVQSGIHDVDAGFIPTYQRRQPMLARSLWDKPFVEGMGACMALRRSVWADLDGFDEMLGLGAPFRAAEDCDFAMHVLTAGRFVLEEPALVVTHHGFRSWRESDDMVRNYLFGLGAMYAKYLRPPKWAITVTLVMLAWRWAFRRPAIDVSHLPPRRLRLTAFIQGLRAGIRTPLDRDTGHYQRTNQLEWHSAGGPADTQ